MQKGLFPYYFQYLGRVNPLETTYSCDGTHCTIDVTMATCELSLRAPVTIMRQGTPHRTQMESLVFTELAKEIEADRFFGWLRTELWSLARAGFNTGWNIAQAQEAGETGNYAFQTGFQWARDGGESFGAPIIATECEHNCGWRRGIGKKEHPIVDARIRLDQGSMPLLALLLDDPFMNSMEDAQCLRDIRFLLPSQDIVSSAEAALYLIAPEIFMRVFEFRKRVQYAETDAALNAIINNLPAATRADAVEYYARHGGDDVVPPVAGVPVGTRSVDPHAAMRGLARSRSELLDTMPNGTTIRRQVGPSGAIMQFVHFSEEHMEFLLTCSHDEYAADFRQLRQHQASFGNWYDGPILVGDASVQQWGDYNECYVPNDHVILIPYHGLWVTSDHWERYKAAVLAKLNEALVLDPPERQRQIDAYEKRERLAELQRKLADEKRRHEVAKSRAEAAIKAEVALAQREVAARPQAQARSSKKKAVRERRGRRAYEMADLADSLAHVADQNDAYQGGLARDNAIREANEAKERVDAATKAIEDCEREHAREAAAREAARTHRVPAMPTLDQFIQARM